jgi:hypothetical protein
MKRDSCVSSWLAESPFESGRSEFDSKNHPVLEVIENTGHFAWLGVRDDFRNWLIREA